METLDDAVKSGDKLRILHALWYRLAARIDAGVSARDMPAIVKQLQDCMREYEYTKHPELRPKARRPGRPSTRWDDHIPN